MAANPYEKLPKVLEDAFIKVSFEEDNASATGTHKAYDEWIKNASADRVSTDEYSHALFKKAYPNHTLVIAEGIDILNIPMVDVEPMFPEQMITSNFFYALARREAIPGVVLQQTKFGAFRVQFEAHSFIVYIATYSKIYGASYPQPVHFILSDSGSEDPAKELILTAGVWANTLHNEILVFQDGYWRKDSSLWLELQKADWKDVILDADRKAEIRKDVYGFFKSEQIYKDLSIPWKRGLIMYGPPGNGKTISIKAIMKECFDKGFTPMYVKSFKFWGGEEAAMQNCFSGARREAPCVLIIEDLDSLITANNRSFFLNQLDGFEGNDGILCVGTTNHLDRLDPALSNRPSRFDKNYFFGDPNRDERALYVRYWQKKLKSNKTINFPDTLVDEVADSTEKFSFAYLKEAFVSTLFKLATQDETEELEFEPLLKKTIQGLRKALDKGEPKDFQPRATPQQQLTFVSKEGMEKYSKQLKEQDEAQDLQTRAAAALRLGRRFIY